MKVINLPTNEETYNCNPYLILGSWNKLEDINALIDAGADNYLVKEIEKQSTGVGKKPVDKVIITHNHFDHTGAVQMLKEKYGAEILAFIKFPGVDRVLKEGESFLLGDKRFEVIHTPGHSSDSICLYCADEGVLFSGDMTIRVYAQDGSYSDEYIKSIEKLSKLKINVIYPGHGEPITENPELIISNTLKILNKKI